MPPTPSPSLSSSLCSGPPLAWSFSGELLFIGFLLVAVYISLIIGLEGLAGAITGQAGQQSIVVVVSTLAIAALFHPMRKRIQSVIDRRFSRKKKASFLISCFHYHGQRAGEKT